MTRKDYDIKPRMAQIDRLGRSDLNQKEHYLVSVVVPTLNEEKFIGDLLRSLRKQTYRNFEVIVVDGGSCDRTLRIGQEFQTKTIIRPMTPEYRSRNIGASVAKGQILLFTSADIIFPSNSLADLVEQFARDASLSAICGSGKMYDAPLWARMEYDAYYKLLHAWARVTKDFHGSTNFMAVRKRDFDETTGFQQRFDSDGNFLNNLGKKKKVKLIATETLVSGRRAARMGFLGFNAHFLHLIDIFVPFLRETRLMNSLKGASSRKRLVSSRGTTND